MQEEQTSTSVHTIDAHYLGPRRASVYLIIENGRATFVDTNTVYAVPYMLDALERAGLTPDAVDYVLVTHVHLDHAGGASELLSHCPNAVALVHPKTRRHLANPDRLVSASREIYGDHFDAIYGEIRPMPDERMRTVADGETLTWGTRTFTFFHTLGHATHHYCVHDSGTGGVFTGDSFGIAYDALQHGRRPYIFAAATPTEFDAPEARRAVQRILEFHPKCVFLGHFGCFHQVPAMAEQLMRTIDRAEALIDEAVASDMDDASLRGWMHERVRAISHEELAACGLPVNEDTLFWIEPDIMLNGQGLLAAALKKRRRNRGAQKK